MAAPLRRVSVIVEPSRSRGKRTSMGQDRSYDPRVSVPDARHSLERWRKASEAVRQHTPFLADIAYGKDPAMRLDIHPTHTPNAPVLLLFHGSMWQMVGKDDFSFLTTGFTDAGICVVNVDHAHCSTVGLLGLRDQAQQAVLWVEQTIGYFGGDPARLFAAGHAFGGTLAVNLLDTDWRRFGRTRNLIKGACAVSGLYDLLPLLTSTLNDVLKMRASDAQTTSPLFSLPDRSPPLIVAVGGDEPDAMQHQQRNLVEARQQRQLPVQVIPLPHQSQIDTVQALGQASAPVNAALVQLIKSLPG